MTANLMTSYGYEPNFPIFSVPGAYEAFLDAVIAFDENDRLALNAAHHAALAIEEAYMDANMTFRRSAYNGASIPVYPARPNLTDFIMDNIVAMLRGANKAA